jgi:hypothetical protein
MRKEIEERNKEIMIGKIKADKKTYKGTENSPEKIILAIIKRIPGIRLKRSR